MKWQARTQQHVLEYTLNTPSFFSEIGDIDCRNAAGRENILDDEESTKQLLLPKWKTYMFDLSCGLNRKEWERPLVVERRLLFISSYLSMHTVYSACKSLVMQSGAPSE